MSAKIYSAPKEIEEPKWDFKNFDYKKHQAKEDKYLKDLKQFLKERGYTGKNVGKVIKFPVADGHALYMVMSMKPVQLIHLELGDAWSFQYIHLMTAKEVQQKIDQEIAINKLFGGK